LIADVLAAADGDPEANADENVQADNWEEECDFVKGNLAL